MAAAYQAVFDEHQIALDGLILVRPGGIPKTTSGKLQRRATRIAFEDGSLATLASWRRDVDGAPAGFVAAAAKPSLTGERLPTIATDLSITDPSITGQQRTAIQELAVWMQGRVAELAGIANASAVNTDQPLALFGLKSLAVVRLTGDLSEKLGKPLAPTLAYDYPTIDALCEYLVTGRTRVAQAKQHEVITGDEPLAIVGLGCRLPGAASIAAFTDLLLDGQCAIGKMSESRGRVFSGFRDQSLRERNCGFLDEVDQFDPLFFTISPREAEEMDPQQRLMLEVCVEAFEDAGITQANLQDSLTGVFIGVSGAEYSRAMALSGHAVSGHTATGNSFAIIANRISYLFNLRGPSLAIDTACSSSLVAVHQAAQALWRGECNLAVAGGVSLICSPDVTTSLSQAGMLSPTGASRAFAAGADGFVRGEGCGAVVLKRLSQAERDGDRIIAVLRGSAVNQDGRSNGLTAPNGIAQQEVIQAALSRAGLEPAAIDYIEAHGTGTELGDPIEMGALNAVFTPRAEPLYVGSVKTNIGHLEGAAGIAGLIKACLVLSHGEIPPHLHFDQPSPHIDWRPEVRIAKERVSLKSEPQRPRRAGVSSFGFGGTNAHVIVEAAPSAVVAEGHASRVSYPWLKLSAKTGEALVEQAARYRAALETGTLADAALADVVYAANVGRSDFGYRAMLSAVDRSALVKELAKLAHRTPDSLAATKESRAGWWLSELDTATANAWSKVFETPAESEAVALDTVRATYTRLRSLLGVEREPRLHALAVQLSLVEGYLHWLGTPQQVGGVGLGSLAAAVSAGVLTSDEALEIGKRTLQDRAGVSGYVSNLPVRAARCMSWGTLPSDAAGWVTAIERIENKTEYAAFTASIGPKLLLGTAAALNAGINVATPCDASLAAISQLIADMYSAGVAVNWRAVQGHRRKVVSLPTYPFQRQRCWFRTSGNATNSLSLNAIASSLVLDAESAASRFLGAELDVAGRSHVFETQLANFPELADHRVRGASVFPAAGYIELMLEAGTHLIGGAVTVDDLRFEQALRWSLESGVRVQVTLQPEGEAYLCEVLSRQASGWVRHATGKVSATVTPNISIQQTPQVKPDTSWSVDAHYRHCADVGLEYSGVFRGLLNVQVDADELVAQIAGQSTHRTVDAYLHPAELDACFQSIAAFVQPSDDLWLPVAVRKIVTGARQSQIDAAGLCVHVRKSGSEGDDRQAFDLEIFGRSGEVLAILEGLVLQRVVAPRKDVAREDSGQVDGWTFEESWVVQPRRESFVTLKDTTASALAESLLPVRDALAIRSGYAQVAGLREVLDQVSGAWTYRTLDEIYGPLERGTVLQRARLMSDGAIAPNKAPLLQRLFEILAEDGIAKIDADKVTMLRHLPSVDPVQLTKSFIDEEPRLAPELLLLARCGAKLGDVLRGDEDPLPLLFSDKVAGTATDVYAKAVGAVVLNGLVAESVARIARQMVPGRAVRILEIGGGTAATTHEVLNRLTPGTFEYTFTDIGRSFITAAEEEFGHLNVRCARLDIEQSPATQGFNLGDYDIVIAANVLHATSHLEQTVEHASQLLAPGGQLLLLEGTRPVRWMDLTFGMTDGWWRHAGSDQSRKHALISPDAWAAALQPVGFVDVAYVAPSAAEGATAENVLLIATKSHQRRTVGSQPAMLIATAAPASNETSLEQRLCGQPLWEQLSKACETWNVHREVIPVDRNSHAAELVEQPIKELCAISEQVKFVYVAGSAGVVNAMQDLMQESESLIAALRAFTTVAHGQRASERNVGLEFVLLTQGAYAVDDSVAIDPVARALWGIVKSFAFEQPDVRCRMIDVADADGVAALDEIMARQGERECLIHSGKQFVRRLKQVDVREGLPSRSALRIHERGSFEAITLEHEVRRELSGDEVEIDIRATGINFRDVLNALGRYPEPIPFGAECAGIVLRVGPDVKRIRPGDAVVALVADCFATTVVAHDAAVAKLPQGWTFADAASLPVAYLTAAVGLRDIAKIKARERVLVHAATGGVGLAAVELVRAANAELFATCSPPKQCYLHGQGIRHVYNSRDNQFAQAILDATNGQGVDVVLNLLDESMVEANLRALAPHGRYIDITKPADDVAAKVRSLRPDVRYEIFDLAEMIRNQPAALRVMLEQLFAEIEQGGLRKLPFTEYDLQETPRAFRKMQRATQIGKLVLTRSGTSERYHAVRRPIRSDGAYVIVGGLGDLGLLTAECFARNGAGLIALVGRKQPDETQQHRIKAIEALGAEIQIYQADASNIDAMSRVFEDVRRKYPVRGVVHSAGVLADAMLSGQTVETLQRVYRSKVQVAEVLHQLTRNDSLDLFVVYSSVAAILGAPGQANHSAANSYLDALCQSRWHEGLPAAVINWGPWAQMGKRQGVV